MEYILWIFQVLAINSSITFKGKTVELDLFGINWLNCGIDATLAVDVFALAELTVKYFLI